ncbi:hypothetical protein [Teredinibacter turnerae]|uniref:hypothetical protein n=1 Tax=Teredinibacter turnerae TaxID=2426 RepID=UPI000376E84D|nr:hypothetical protein [Teredinibacter turnerae]
MSNNITSQNPALEINSIISEFYKLLDGAGAVPTARLIKSAKAGNYDSVSSVLNEFLLSLNLGKATTQYNKFLELAAEIVAGIQEESYFSHIKFPPLPEIGHDNKENVIQLITFVVHVKAALQPLIDDEVGSNKKNQFLSAIENKKKILNKGFFYEFTDGDLDRVQQLINELRSEITQSDLFEESHRARLLRRLEAMQSEMHKKMSDVDRIWGLVGDAGIVIGKFGKDAKPFVDRIRELSQIAWKTQARAEELPSSIQNPLIESDSDKV